RKIPALPLTLVALAILAPAALAQHITIDGTLSPAQVLSGPNYSIGANLGKRVGGNLFQSFGLFGLASGETATFSGPATVTTIIGRVTGGSPSTIDGTVKSSIKGANLYLTNPTGVVFGPGGSVNVTGSFSASTADYLKLKGGVGFSATNPNGSTLSAAAPAAFGFLDAPAGKITVSGTTLQVKPGQTLDLVGGPVSVKNASLLAPGGTIGVAAANGPGQVAATPSAAVPAVAGFARLTVAHNSAISTTDANGPRNSGNIFVDAGTLAVRASTIDANNYGPGPGGDVVVDVTHLSLSNGGEIAAATDGSGDAGSLTIGVAGGISIDGAQGAARTGIFSEAVAGSTGNAGAISVTAHDLSLTDSGAIFSSTFSSGNAGRLDVSLTGRLSIGGVANNLISGIFSDTEGAGNAGQVSIAARNVGLTGDGRVSSSTSGSGNGGSVDVTAAGRLYMADGAEFASDTAGPGNGGGVTLTAGTILIDGAHTSFLTGIASNAITGSTGQAGFVTVTAGNLTLKDTGEIESGTAGAGNAGDVSVDVTGLLALHGSAAPAATGILGQAEGGTGNGGRVTVDAGSLSITRSAEIDSSTFTAGNAGSVSVTVGGQLSIDGALNGFSSAISSDAFHSSYGNAGQVTVSADSLSLTNGGQISTSTLGPGSAGNIGISVAGSLSIDGTGGSGVLSESAKPRSGAAGTINIAAGTLSLSDGGQISTSTFSPNNAGSVVVGAGSVSLATGGEILSSTTGSGNAGSVAVSSPGALTIDGSGGALTGIFSSANAGTGNGGRITVNAGSLSILANGEISTSTATSGAGGDVAVAVGGAIGIDGSGARQTTGILSDALVGSAGAAGTVVLSAGSLTVSGSGSISSTTAGSSSGGTVDVAVSGPVSLSGAGGGILASAATTATGNAGSVTVEAGQLTIAGGAQIASTMAGSASGGSVTVTTPGTLALSGAGSEIAASASGAQSLMGGPVTVTAGTLLIGGGAQIASTTAGHGSGGDILIEAPTVVLGGAGPQITAQSTGTGNAGSITVIAQTLTMIDGASISTEAAGANGGDITLEIGREMLLVDSSILTSVDGLLGNGGNITIDPQFLVLDRSQIEADAVGGNGGNISIVAGRYIASADSTVEASSQLGISGAVDITSPVLQIKGALASVASDLKAPAAIAPDSCGSKVGQLRSSFTAAGRGGVTQDPDDVLPALYLAGRELDSTATHPASGSGPAPFVPHLASIAALPIAPCR
ncbi:MAG TPA: filamentous hemagglutinin N-terminal domain-containing protein, partial [Stellaceae bacterium]|nr:filamentous hemagglutinin N-terminal domain-containing protein [Stellaceae bacterium]